MGLELATIDRTIARQRRAFERHEARLLVLGARMTKLARDCYLEALDLLHTAPTADIDRVVEVVSHFRELLERAERPSLNPAESRP